MPQQIIQDRYIDQNQLLALLARKFTPGTYTIAVGTIRALPSTFSSLRRGAVEDG